MKKIIRYFTGISFRQDLVGWWLMLKTLFFVCLTAAIFLFVAFLILLFLTSINLFPMENIKLTSDGKDSTALCQERGHVKGGVMESTMMKAKPYILETDSSTVLITPGVNTITYTCLRCGERVKEKEKETRQILWESYWRKYPK